MRHRPPRSEYQHLPRNLRSGGGRVIVISLVHIDDSFSVIFRYTLEMELHWATLQPFWEFLIGQTVAHHLLLYYRLRNVAQMQRLGHAVSSNQDRWLGIV